MPTARRALLSTIAVDGSDLRTVLESREHLEAPNWSPDGQWLVYNSGGALWRIPPAGSAAPERIDTGDVDRINNDHLIANDGRTIYFSAAGHLYAVPFAGGPPRRVSNDHDLARRFQYYLHGISPDGTTLAYVGVEQLAGQTRADLWTIPAAGGPDTRLTDYPAPDDGPEYSPDGQWIYFNSERAATVPGHAQCFRMRADGRGVEQLTRDERVNWFPHVSPDGAWVVYLSYPPGTLGHPADREVILRRMRPDGSEPLDLLTFWGGQGSLNVNSWSPCSQRLALVIYDRE